MKIGIIGAMAQEVKVLTESFKEIKKMGESWRHFLFWRNSWQ